MEENIYGNFMVGVNKLTPAERNKVAKAFREDLKTYKVRGAVMKIVDSNSSKNPVYVNVLVQQCRKAQFALEFDTECDKLRALYKQTRPEISQRIRALHEVVRAFGKK